MHANSPDRQALHAQLVTQLDFLTELARSYLDALGQLGTLNLHAARQLQGDAMALGRALAACRDPLQILPTTMRVSQQAAEHWRSWQSGVMHVLATSGATFAQATDATRRQIARTST